MSRRTPGVRLYLLLAMMALAAGSVAVTGLLIHRNVAAELEGQESRLADRLADFVLEAIVEAGLFSAVLALLLALPLALHLARPLRRLNELATRMARGQSTTPGVVIGGGRELGELGDALERLAATLRRQDETRRATVADVTHELRGVLGSVVGRAEAARDGVMDAQVALRQIEEDGRRLGRLVDDVRLLSEAQRPGLLMDTQSVDLAAIVRERLSAFAQRFQGASLALEERLDPVCVDGDPERLTQVVDNLLLNALRYTEPGGRVTVSVRRTGDEAVLEVTDTGIGISQAHLTRIFDRFWRAPSARGHAIEGTGVGLAIVRDLVLAHHGRIEVQSRLGKGSSFGMHLPVDVPATGDEAMSADGPSERAAPEPAVWSLRGDVDIANAAVVQRELMQHIWSTSGDLMLDLSEVGMFGSAGLAILVAADAEVRARGGRMIIVAARPEVLQLLELVGVPRSPSAAAAAAAAAPVLTPVP